MYQLASNAEIGQCLKKEILRHYKSQRQFSVEYLKFTLPEAANDPNEIEKMAGRISKITKGKQEISLADLAVFSQLLGISCETILSAGTYVAPAANRISNYSAAHSDDPVVWEKFAKHPDGLMFRSDEYNRNVLDYAFEAKNYAFLKFMEEKGYIRYSIPDEKDKQYCQIFLLTSDIHDSHLSEPRKELYSRTNNPDYRTRLIGLAIEHEDIAMLDRLYAKSTPEISSLAQWVGNILADEIASHCNDEMIQSIAGASKTILDYYSQPIRYPETDQACGVFMFPFIDQVILKMLENKTQNTEIVLKNLIIYQKEILDLTREWLSRNAKIVFQQEYPRFVPEGKIMPDDYALQRIDRCAQNAELIVVHDDFRVIKNFVRVYDSSIEKDLIANIFTFSIPDNSPFHSELDEINNLYREITNCEEFVKSIIKEQSDKAKEEWKEAHP